MSSEPVWGARAIALIACGVWLGVSGRAAAQTDGQSGAGQSAEGQSAEGQSTEGQSAEGQSAEPVDQAALEAEARTRFQQGVALARAGDCRGAIAELTESLRLLPRPGTLFNLAQCQEELHRYDLAVRDYERYLELAPADGAERPQVEAQLRALRNLLGTLHVDSNVPGEVWLEDRIVGIAPGDVLVPGGHHAIEVRADGYIAVRREVDVAARRTVTVEVTLEQAQTTIEQTTIEQHIDQHVEQHEHITVERPPLPEPVFWTGVALTAACAIVGAAGGINAIVTHDQQAMRDARLPRDTQAIRDSALVADIGFVGAGVFLTTTVIVAFLTDWGTSTTGQPADTGTTSTTTGADDADAEDGETSARSSAPRASLLPLFDGRQGGLSLEVSF